MSLLDNNIGYTPIAFEELRRRRWIPFDGDKRSTIEKDKISYYIKVVTIDNNRQIVYKLVGKRIFGLYKHSFNPTKNINFAPIRVETIEDIEAAMISLRKKYEIIQINAVI